MALFSQKSAYITEVHHINDEGEDAGVVYCEMQDCENTAENRTRLAFVRNMYPGKCGYKSETGGNLVVKEQVLVSSFRGH